MLSEVKNKNLAFWMLNTVAPLIIGTLIYLLFRPTSLLVFKWIEIFPDLENFVFALRLYFKNAHTNDFLIYSIPTGLWSYSAQVSILRIWKDDEGKARYWWLCLFLIMIYMSEIGQAFGVIPGTFDFEDLMALSASTLIAIAYGEFKWSKINIS